MQINELKRKITEQAFRLKKAQTAGAMVAQETDRMRNVLVNNLDEIVEALEYAASAESKIEMLTVEIDSADAELKEKDEEIRALKENRGAMKQKPKTKEPAADVEQGIQ